MPLTEAAIKAAKPREKPFKLADARGLFLLVNPSGSKLWRLKYRSAGKEQLLALGAYPEVTLKDARAKRDEARLVIRDGRNPAQERKAAKQRQRFDAKNAFKTVVLEFVDKMGKRWSSRHRDNAISRLEANIFPYLGRRPVGQIEPPELLEVLRKIEARGAHEMAIRIRALCGQVFRYGIACGVCTRDPAADLRGALTPPKSGNMPCIPIEELPALLRAIDASEEAPACRDRQTRIGLQLLALLFPRTVELRKAQWAEILWEDRLWAPPPEVMKMKRPHLVPLPPQAIALLEELREITGRGRYVFPGEGKKGIMSENTLLYSLYALGYRGRMSGHGFRSLASTILNEAGFDPDHIELQLAHQDENESRRAYNYARWIDPRREMMTWYASYLDELRKGEFLKPHLFRREATGAPASL
jgi:integrase